MSMKKRIITVLTIVLAVICAFSACTQKDKKDGEETRRDTLFNERGDYIGGTHVFNVKERDSYILKDGNTEYKVVISSSAKKEEANAASEFTKLFLEATGTLLPVVTDSSLTYSSDAKYISFGENSFATGSGVKTDPTVKGNGYIIKTVGNSVFVKGGYSIGTLFGAYELLNQMLDYMCYAVDCYYINTEVKNIKLCDYDILDNPDIDQRLANYGVIYNDSALAHKLRFQPQYAEVYMNPTRAFHNTMGLTNGQSGKGEGTTAYLPPYRFESNHPKWYSDDGKQLCYTAHGIKTEYDAMVNAMADALKPYIEAEPEKRIISVSQEDNFSWCGCDSCLELKMKYGSDSAGNLMFVNDVAEKIEKWLDENHKGRDLTVATFAYYKSEVPPARQNEKGEWEPIDEKVIARDNVTILYAPLALMEFNHSLEDEENRSVLNILDGWAACSKHVAIWNYQTHFTSYFMPYNTYSACQEQYKKYLDMGASWIFDQGQQNNGNSTHFSMLKIYLNSQWGWDVNRDYNTLVDNFFTNYFGSKDGAMRKMYEELRTWLVHLDNEGLGGRCSDTADSAEYWPQRLVAGWLDLIAEAYEEIEPLKETNPDKYEMYARHIKLESMMPRYMAISYYLGMYTSLQQDNMKQEFAEDCRELNITHVREMGAIDNLIGRW